MKRRLSAISCLAVALMAGCVGQPTKEAPWVSRAELAESINATAERLACFRATISLYVDIKDWEHRGTVDGLLALAPGDRMRLKLDLLGKPVVDVVCDGTTLAVADAEHRVLREATLAELAAGESVLTPATFRAAFLAEPLPPSFLVKRQRDHYAVIVPSAAQTEAFTEITVDRATRTVRRLVAYDAQGVARLEVTYDRYRVEDGVPVPTHVELRWPEKGAFLKVDLEQIQFEASDRLFALPDDYAAFEREPLLDAAE